MDRKNAKSNFGSKGWGIIFYVLLLFLFSAAPIDLLNISVGAFAELKQWDSNTLLAFSSIGGWIGVIGTLLYGQLVVKKGVKGPTIFGLLLLGVLFILNGQVNSIALYGLVVILLSVLSNCINLVSTNTLMSNWFPTKKGLALGWASMGMPISSAVCIPIFAGVLHKTGSIGTSFNIFGIAVILLAVATFFLVKALPEEAGAHPDNEPITEEQRRANILKMKGFQSQWTLGSLLICRQMWLVTFVFGFLFIGILATMTQFVPRFMASGFSQSEAIMWLSIAAVLGIIGSYLWGVLDQLAGTKKATLIFAAYMAILQFLGAIFIHDKTISAIIIVLLGILIGGIGNLFPSMVIQIFGRYEFPSANRLIVPLLTILRTSAFIIMVVTLSQSNGSYRVLSIVLGCFATAAFFLSLFLSNKTISKVHSTMVN